MSDKERLEEIKKLSYLSSLNGYNKKVLLDKHGSWLIGQIECKQLLEEENKKLREALEFYADEKKYEENIKTTYGYTCEIASDEGNTAKKALEQPK